jgi:amino-acid N-acetyltransferase
MSARPRIRLHVPDASAAGRLHALIAAHREEGHLLPRTREDLAAHAARFVVAMSGRRMVGCAELAPLSPQIGEVRSLVVRDAVRHLGVGTAIVEELRRRARRQGLEKLCAFTHAPGYFIPMGFSIVPHLWLPEKIFTDCVHCPLFRRCGQFAMEAPIEGAAEPADHESAAIIGCA